MSSTRRPTSMLPAARPSSRPSCARRRAGSFAPSRRRAVASKPSKDKGHDPAAHELIIIRRVEEDEHEAHNSAWKVAHADFMTAMMAFFLIMWLINATDEETRKGI